MATLRETFSDIAKSIRAKGVSGTMKPIDMASKIGEIQTGGGSDYGYLTFTAKYGATKLNLKQYGDIAPHKLLKSTDGVNWTKWENPATNEISLNIGESVYLKADEDALGVSAKDDWKYNYFTITEGSEFSGDIRSIFNKFFPYNYNYFASRLFQNCTSLTKAPELPATTLANYCYTNMFGNCTSLTQAPELPATTLTDYCYSFMFGGCSSLTQAPELPATTLASNCYSSMFNGCTSLTTAPELPATKLSINCYSSMFNGCTSLTTAPELPATTLSFFCYSAMFQNCTSLKRIKMNASSGNWGESMFFGCTSLELVDMTGSTGVPQLANVNNFDNTNDTYKIVVPDSLYDTWIAETNWVSIASHIMKQSDWNAAHPDDILP